MSRWGNKEPGNFTHIIALSRTVYCCHFGSNLKIWRTMQLLLPHKPLTYLHLQSHHSRFTHAAILVLTSPYTATIGYIFFFFFTWQVPHYNRNTHKSLSSSNPSHSAQILHILGLLLMIWYGPCTVTNIFPIHIPTMLFYIHYYSTLQHTP